MLLLILAQHPLLLHMPHRAVGVAVRVIHISVVIFLTFAVVSGGLLSSVTRSVLAAVLVIVVFAALILVVAARAVRIIMRKVCLVMRSMRIRGAVAVSVIHQLRTAAQRHGQVQSKLILILLAGLTSAASPIGLVWPLGSACEMYRRVVIRGDGGGGGGRIQIGCFVDGLMWNRRNIGDPAFARQASAFPVNADQKQVFESLQFALVLLKALIVIVTQLEDLLADTAGSCVFLGDAHWVATQLIR
mmetsp:Transcript_10863/g.19062  ORF Transcript_10863/g.19062 Transcript_10863/m.19062 type:complete len:245 (+) Transcript_10863:111-845(+)